jgi:hypothetical protein
MTTIWLALHCRAWAYAFALADSTSIGAKCEHAEHAVWLPKTQVGNVEEEEGTSVMARTVRERDEIMSSMEMAIMMLMRNAADEGILRDLNTKIGAAAAGIVKEQRHRGSNGLAGGSRMSRFYTVF